MQPKVFVSIENYHFEEIKTEKKPPEDNNIKKQRKELKLKRQKIDTQIDELKQKYFSQSERESLLREKELLLQEEALLLKEMEVKQK